MKHHHALVQWPLLAISFTLLCSEVLSMLIDVELNASITTNSQPSTKTINSTTNSTVSTGEDVTTKDFWQLLGSNIYLVLAVGGLLLCAAIWLAWRYFCNNSAESEDNARGNENGVQLTDSSQSPSEPSPEDQEIPSKDASKVDKKRKNALSEAISKPKKGAKRVKSPAQRRPLTTIDNLTSGQETSSGATSGATSSIGSTLPATNNSKASQAGSKKGSTASPIKRTSMLKSMVGKMKSMVVNAFSAKKEEKDEEGKKKDKKDKKKAKKDKDKPESPPSP